MMDEIQEREWLDAQSISLGVDLVPAAQQQLKFLTAVDRHRCLYGGLVLQRAIYRYKTCWLPLLAKHTNFPLLDGPLVVPLDCEWIWHCHRLNPVQYNADCVKVYGKILDNENVRSTTQEVSHGETKNIWHNLYKEEPYELDLHIAFGSVSIKNHQAKDAFDYDFVSASQRQQSFVYQVMRPSMFHYCYLEDAVARYKGFLHLIRRNREASPRCFCVPTYDIDLLWHSHQLHPVCYGKDMIKVLGRILEHDDTDSDRTKGNKLDTAFSETTKQWEEMFGKRYWRAGAMYRGSTPTPVAFAFWGSNVGGKATPDEPRCDRFLELSKIMVIEVILEIVGLRNLLIPKESKLLVSVRKNGPDLFISEKKLFISESGKKHVLLFECEPNGKLIVDVISRSPSVFPMPRSHKIVGSASFSLDGLHDPKPKLLVEELLDLSPKSVSVGSGPVALHVGMSFTVPTVAPFLFHLFHYHPSDATSVSSCAWKLQQCGCLARAQDVQDKEIFILQIRNNGFYQQNLRDALWFRDSGTNDKELFCKLGQSHEQVLAKFTTNGWSIVDSSMCLQVKRSDGGCGIMLESILPIKLIQGRKLEYETKFNRSHKIESEFMTVVRFSGEYPYGKAIALLSLRSVHLKVSEEWFALPGLVLLCLLSRMFCEGGHNGITIVSDACVDRVVDLLSVKEISPLCNSEIDLKGNRNETNACLEEQMVDTANSDAHQIEVPEGCEFEMDERHDRIYHVGFSGTCQHITDSIGGCANEHGSCCELALGSVLKRGGCGGGCGVGCGAEMADLVRTGGCSDCGGGCGADGDGLVKSGGGCCGGRCGGECGAKWDDLENGGRGCGGGCGGGCGAGWKGPFETGPGCGGGCGGNCGGGCGILVR